ncbi:MAG: ABC transporter ATP-binding protein [Myxococcota bacterium]
MSAPDPDAPRLRVRGLTKHYRATVALDGLDFDLQGGELLGLIGPNGAGKSTASRIITGQLLPDAGEVLVAGHRVDREPMEARRLTGYVPQDLTLYPFLTGREILEFVSDVRGLPRDEAAALADRLLTRFALADDQHRLAREYSEGMARKLSIAAALVGDPALLVLDESLNGLDPRAAAEVKDVLRERVDAGAAVVLVSHQLEVLERLCTRVVLVDRGRLRADLSRGDLDAMAGRGETLEGFFLEHTAGAEHVRD